MFSALSFQATGNLMLKKQFSVDYEDFFGFNSDFVTKVSTTLDKYTLRLLFTTLKLFQIF